ncbi:HNH endonuclease signature motif containing protein [Marininema mesophilum]|uniref:HNH endonuclease signature motif containing protein n=1 Tax=Marininema mesophilum TaxID=1048340 RepID=UPI000B808EAA|nr:HNH endonuclease signature motif containing protein [Marininema mesophilum]
MPSKPLRPCNYPGCPGLAQGRYCEEHTKQESQRYEQSRGSASQRGYGSSWRKARATYLKRSPLCVGCEKAGRLTPATVVDHVVPHKGDTGLFWDKGNWQSLCKRCHDRKTATEDGRWGLA